MASFQGAMAKYIPYAGANPEWYISHAGYHSSMARLKVAGGGNTISDIQAGMRPEFLGYPVNITQVLPGGLGTTSQTVAYFGDLSFGCAMGDARDLTIMQSEHRYFEYDQVGVRATKRWDIQVHGRGTATSGGPIIALKLG
jgi:HK97 family phage major capsid protein